MAQAQYSEAFKKQAVQKYLSRGNRPVTEIAQELGTSAVPIYLWVKSYRNGTATVSHLACKPDSFSASEKFSAVMEFGS